MKLDDDYYGHGGIQHGGGIFIFYFEYVGDDFVMIHSFSIVTNPKYTPATPQFLYEAWHDSLDSFEMLDLYARSIPNRVRNKK